MAIKTREEIIAQINSTLGDTTSDNAIALIEDITDTYNDLSTKANGGGKDWKKKYEDNDKAWRKKYVDRFSSGGTGEDKPDDKLDDKPKNYSYDSLWK